VEGWREPILPTIYLSIPVKIITELSIKFMPKVFVTNAQRRKALPVVRSLGKRKIHVTVGDTARFPFAAFSRYCRRAVIYPSPSETPDAFVDWLLEHLKYEQYDVIFPLDEDVIDTILPRREEVEQYTRLPLPEIKQYCRARDKAETIKIAMKCNIACPKTYFVESLEELEFLIKQVDFPLVIKPRRSFGGRGLVFTQTRETLKRDWLKVHQNYPFPLIQEFIPQGGDAFGVSALFNSKHEVRTVFVHRRIREYPVSGGPSTLRESVYNPTLMETGIELLRKLNWYGVAMVEFKVDPRDGKSKLMEINPRFWGSLPLAIYSGVDFPYLLYRMAIEGDIEPHLEYQVGVKCRWLIGDFMHFLTNPNRLKLNPSFFHFSSDTKYDVESFEDAFPFFGYFFSVFIRMFDKGFRKDVTRR
jgi:predicted ATP-grasp superfamily ATP-dependent carboligase